MAGAAAMSFQAVQSLLRSKRLRLAVGVACVQGTFLPPQSGIVQDHPGPGGLTRLCAPAHAGDLLPLVENLREFCVLQR